MQRLHNSNKFQSNLVEPLAFGCAAQNQILNVQGNKDIESNPTGIRVLTKWKAR
jgi:hypothetical protein